MLRQRLVDQYRHLPKRTRTVVLTCLYGVGAGTAAVAFQLGMNLVYQRGLVALSHQSFTVFLLGSLFVITAASLLVGWLLSSFCPEAAGSGVPQLKAAFWKDFGYVPWNVVWVKFVAGVVSIGGGCSLGREGPSVQLAGALASNLGGLAGEPKQNRRFGAAAGAAAGLAAAFNTPMAAIAFVLEEIIGDLNSRYMGGLLLASVIGAFMVHGIIGRQPSFFMPSVETPTWIGYALTPLVAALAAVVGVYFQKASIGLRGRSKRSSALPMWAMPVAGGLITWGLGVAVFRGTGRLGVLASATAISPMRSPEASAGRSRCSCSPRSLPQRPPATGLEAAAVYSLLHSSSGEWSAWRSQASRALRCISPRADLLTVAVVGMSATLGAVVRAPVTGVLIVFEMTHEFGLVPALLLGTLVSQAISRKMLKHNFYDALLKEDGVNLEQVQPPRDLRSWHQLPASAIANFQPTVARSLAPADLEQLLKTAPYARFPVVEGDRLVGILSRDEAALAAKERRVPRLMPAVAAEPSQSVEGLQAKLIESAAGVVVLVDQLNGRVLGIVTLHDVLRAQTAMAKDSDA